jgi:hypothetical protein
MVGMAQEFSRFFGRGVRGDGVVHRIVLGKRNLRAVPVNRGGGGKEKTPDPVFPAGLQQADRSPDIHVGIESRILDGRADSGAGRQVSNPIDLRVCENIFQRPFVAQISLRQFEGGVLERSSQIPTFQGGIIKIVKIVQADNPMPFSQEPLHQVGSNEPGTAGNQIFISFLNPKL